MINNVRFDMESNKIHDVLKLSTLNSTWELIDCKISDMFTNIPIYSFFTQLERSISLLINKTISLVEINATWV